MSVRAALLLSVVLATLSPLSRARADETCVSCHAVRAEARLRAPVSARSHDVHAGAGLGCDDCHGGDPDEPSVRAHDLGRGFRGVPDALGVAQVCGRCHDGSREGLSDVAAELRGGHHGRAAALGRATASCTSCHGAHGVLRHDDPTAPVARTHVVDTCAACHADASRMAASGLPTDQAAEWRASVHGEVFAAGSERAPTCASCHDAHGNEAALAAVAACGECHAPIRAAFDAGPHAERFADLGFLDCVECHGSHEIRLADASLLAGLGAACARCHGPGQEAHALVGRIQALAERLDLARAALPRDDPRRANIIAALHALDVDALEAALAALPRAPAETPAHPSPTPDTADDWATRGAITVLVVVALLALALVWRRKRGPT